MELFDLCVEPTARSTGVAGRLVDTAVTLAAGEGATQLYSGPAPRTVRRSGSPLALVSHQLPPAPLSRSAITRWATRGLARLQLGHPVLNPGP
jgi:GNAT superfamily N-acetyltransferase